MSFEDGARNLLETCAGVTAGDRVLIVHEPDGLDYYDDGLARDLGRIASGLKADVELVEVPFDADADSLPGRVQTLVERSDQIVFLARLGDQLRFTDIGDGRIMVVSYALSRQMMSTGFASAHYKGFVSLAELVDRHIAQAEKIEVTCSAGTSFSGCPSPLQSNGGEVSVRRFPKLIFAPVLAKTFSGRVALPGFLVGTGSRYYHPYAAEFDGPVFVLFENGRISGFEGAATDVQRAEHHYDFVAEKFEIERNCIHSWHAGLHPSCAYDRPANANYERWSGSAFGNPRLLHLHTCGANPPGEISLNIPDPTIMIDGVKVWDDGICHIDRVPGAADVLARYPDCQECFRHPVREIGL